MMVLEEASKLVAPSKIGSFSWPCMSYFSSVTLLSLEILLSYIWDSEFSDWQFWKPV